MQPILAFVLSLFVIGYCHLRVKRVRVIGGYRESIERFPFTAAIVVRNSPRDKEYIFAGGAVIVSTFWAVTAAHCISDLTTYYIPQRNVFLRSNTTYWTGPQSRYSSDHLVLEAFVHDSYNTITDDYDVAAVKVKQQFAGKYEIPASVLAGYKYTTGTPAIVLGWGTTNVTNDKDSSVEAFTVPGLRAVEVKIVDSELCVKAYKRINELISPRMLCANAPGKDACVNDSGGPLVQNSTVIGLVSWGIGCAKDEFPGIYTRLSTVREWIEDIQKMN